MHRAKAPIPDGQERKERYDAMKKKVCLILAALLILAIIPATASATEKIKLQFMGREASVYETEANKASIAAFEAANPEYEVEFITGKFADHHTRLMTMMAGNAAPDVFYMEPQFSRAFSDQGLLLDLTDIFKTEFAGVDLIDWSYQKMAIGDKYYGIDSCVVGYLLMINPALFKAAGLEVPSTKEALTWDELIDLAKKQTITDGTTTTQYGVYGFEDWGVLETYLYYNGVSLFNDKGEFEISDPAKAAEIMGKLKGLRTEYGIAPEAAFIENSGMSANQLLKTGKVAMVFEGSYSMQELSKMGFEYIAVKPPVFDKENPVGILGSSYNCAVWSGTKYPEAAKKLASYLCSEDSQLVLCATASG
jgi:multiple sugar transport system substrate-binding protein